MLPLPTNNINMMLTHRHLYHTWATLTNKLINFISKGGPCMKQVPVTGISSFTEITYMKSLFIGMKN